MDTAFELVGPDMVDRVGEVLARWQADPRGHICYLGLTAESIIQDLAALEPSGWDAAIIAVRDDNIIGFLTAEWDDDPARIWWYGPYAAPHLEPEPRNDVLDTLYRRVRAIAPAHLVEEELAPDGRHAWMDGFARRHGFEQMEDASAVLVLGPDDPLAPLSAEVVAVEPATDDDRPVVAALHDRLFPGTHSNGERVASGRHHQLLRVARVDRNPVGYIAAEVQSDGGGYIDYLGVDDNHRRRGIGRALIRDAAVGLRELGVGAISLTVRQSNHGSRDLYTSVGFTEERIIQGWRKGGF